MTNNSPLKLSGNLRTIQLTKLTYEDCIANALIDLNGRIKQGHEFPDACDLCSGIFNVRYEDLRNLYDEQFDK